MATIGAINISVRANTIQFTRGMARVRKSAMLTARNVTRIFSPMSAQFVGIAAGVYGLARAFSSSEGLNVAMQRSLAIMEDVSAGMKKEMRELAISVSGETQFSAVQAAGAYFELASAGLTATQAMEAMPIAAEFAVSGNFDLTQSTLLLTSATAAAGLKVADTAQQMENYTRVGDVLSAANINAIGSTQDFAEALSTKSGAAFRLMKRDVEETTAVLMAFHAQNVRGAQAGTQLNIVYRDLQSKSIKFRSEFRKFGIEVFKASGEINNFADILQDVERALKGMSDETKIATLMELGFENRSRAAMMQLLGFSSQIRIWERDLRDAAGTMKQVAEKQLTPFEKAVARLRAQWQTFADSIHRLILPALQKMMTSMGGWLAQMGKSITASLPDFQKTAVRAFENVKTVVDSLLESFRGMRDMLKEMVMMFARISGASDRADEINKRLAAEGNLGRVSNFDVAIAQMLDFINGIVIAFQGLILVTSTLVTVFVVFAKALTALTRWIIDTIKGSSKTFREQLGLPGLGVDPQALQKKAAGVAFGGAGALVLWSKKGFPEIKGRTLVPHPDDIIDATGRTRPRHGGDFPRGARQKSLPRGTGSGFMGHLGVFAAAYEAGLAKFARDIRPLREGIAKAETIAAVEAVVSTEQGVLGTLERSLLEVDNLLGGTVEDMATFNRELLAKMKKNLSGLAATELLERDARARGRTAHAQKQQDTVKRHVDTFFGAIGKALGVQAIEKKSFQKMQDDALFGKDITSGPTPKVSENIKAVFRFFKGFQKHNNKFQQLDAEVGPLYRSITGHIGDFAKGIKDEGIIGVLEKGATRAQEFFEDLFGTHTINPFDLIKDRVREFFAGIEVQPDAFEEVRKLPGLLIAGTSEAVSFLNRQQIGTGDPQKQLLKVNKKNEINNRKAAAALARIDGNLQIAQANI